MVVSLATVTKPGKLHQDIVEGRSEDDVRDLRNHPEVHACPVPFPVTVPSHWQTHLTSTLPVPVDLANNLSVLPFSTRLPRPQLMPATA